MAKKKTVRKTHKRRTRANPRAQVREYFHKYPDQMNTDLNAIAAKFNCHLSTIATAKREVRAELDGGDRPSAEEVKAVMKMGVARAREAIKMIELVSKGS